MCGPRSTGHVLVIPRTHYQTLANLPPELVAPLFAQVRAVSAAMSAFGAGGSFVGVNNTVDQSVPHLHVHVVPRTRRDGVHGTASLMISVFGRILWPRRRYSGAEEATSYAHILPTNSPAITCPLAAPRHTAGKSADAPAWVLLVPMVLALGVGGADG